MKRDLYIRTQANQADCVDWRCAAFDGVYVCIRQETNKRDVYVWKETYTNEKQPVKQTSSIVNVLRSMVCVCERVCMCSYGKRPIKKTCMCEKRPIQMKRDLWHRLRRWAMCRFRRVVCTHRSFFTWIGLFSFVWVSFHMCVGLFHISLFVYTYMLFLSTRCA